MFLCLDSTTPRESSSDKDSVNAETVNVEKKDTIIENIEMNKKTSISIDEDEDGAVGGIDDDSVFVDDVKPSTKRISTQRSSPRHLSCDNQEEVDDIELIFSSDDKEFPQEDMVSISYYEPWQSIGQSGTPILVNFNNIASDNECGDNNTIDKRQNKDNLSPSPIDPDQFYNAIKENVAQQQYSLESNDSLSVGDNVKRSYDFYAKSASLEKDSDPKSSDENQFKRDESFDTFEQPVDIFNYFTHLNFASFDV